MNAPNSYAEAVEPRTVRADCGESSQEGRIGGVMAVADDVPSIGLGTWQTFDVDRSQYAERRAVLGEFVGLGGRLVDTSPMYGRAEETLGAVREAADPEGRLFLATKVWTRGRDAGITQ